MLLLLLLPTGMRAQQISVTGVQLAPYNVTPEAMLSATIVNNGGETQVMLAAQLFNLNNDLLLTVKSAAFSLRQGLNPPYSRSITTTEYGNTSQADYIRTTHSLPGGTFRICVSVISMQTGEPSDEFCDEIDSDYNQYLYLVNPLDRDTVETTTPLLLWNHSEPFSALAPGEYYRMVVSEIRDQQSAEEAITVNSPLMVKNYLTTHTLQYPYDAQELKEGMRCAWVVQKISNGIVTGTTETWEFVIRKKPDEKNIKYVALMQTLNANFYTAVNGRIYFKFVEEYSSRSGLSAVIVSEKGKLLPVAVSRDDNNTAATAATAIRTTGDNRFVLDLDQQSISPGFYRLEIKNEKKELFYLKFYLPE